MNVHQGAAMTSDETRDTCELVSTQGHNRSRRLLAIVTGCALGVALLVAGPASAASRRFTVHNESNHALKLFRARPLNYGDYCVPSECIGFHWPFEFEGRPEDDSVLRPGETQHWELKHGFSLRGGIQYAAELWYHVQAPGAGYVVYTIETWSTSNESACAFTVHEGNSPFTCTAEGTKLTFRNKAPMSRAAQRSPGAVAP
jgi:hypothetical protein